MDAIQSFASHVAHTRYEDLPPAAVTAAKTFILDSFGVGLAGSSGPRAPALVEAQRRWGSVDVGSSVGVWGNGARLPAPAAAMCNAYQTHCSEFDCVHEKAVVHAMTAVLSVAMSGASRRSSINGRDLILAATVGVDIAAGLGLAAQTGLRFFRPATAGAFGATAALSSLLQFDQATVVNAFSLVYGQVSGTMQAHTEGSMLLAMQMGFNARNAVFACDLAAEGFDGPLNVLEGPFGYFRLIEAAGDPSSLAQSLGREWRVTELAHKPFPSGRATHGVLDGCLEIRQRPGFDPSRVAWVKLIVPPLVNHLVGRPFKSAMDINYARLCARFVAARALLTGTLSRDDFNPAIYADQKTAELANRMEVVVADAGDPNALTPVEVAATMHDGGDHRARIETMLGSPANPLSRAAHLSKFRANARAALHPLSLGEIDTLIDKIDRLDTVANIGDLESLLCAAP